MRYLVILAFLLASCAEDDEGNDCKPGRGYFCSGPDLDADVDADLGADAAIDADLWEPCLNEVNPVAVPETCPEDRYYPCLGGDDEPSASFRCVDGQVLRDDLQVIDLCRCSGGDAVCTMGGPGDELLAHVCDLDCATDEVEIVVGDPSGFDADSLCAQPAPDAGSRP